MAEQSGCQSGGPSLAGQFSLDVCAASCKGSDTTMFVFGRSGGSKCDENDHCKCFCLHKANRDGTCTEKTLNNFDLYKINYYTGKYREIEILF